MVSSFFSLTTQRPTWKLANRAVKLRPAVFNFDFDGAISVLCPRRVAWPVAPTTGKKGDCAHCGTGQVENVSGGLGGCGRWSSGGRIRE